MENILTTHNYEKGEFVSSQSGGYGLDFKINNASLNTQVENISLHYIFETTRSEPVIWMLMKHQ